MHPEEIAVLLRRAVRRRTLRPGQPLNQDHLARRLGVSRVPVREALRTLVGEGLVAMRSGMGAVVVRLGAEEVEELYDLRLQLEPSLAHRLTDNAGERDIEALGALLPATGAAAGRDPEEWSALDYAFRRRLYGLAGRPQTVRLVVQVLNLVEPYARRHARDLDGPEAVRRRLAREVAALRDRDAGRLAVLIAEHLTGARRGLVAAMRAAEGPGDDMTSLFSGL